MADAEAAPVEEPIEINVNADPEPTETPAEPVEAPEEAPAEEEKPETEEKPVDESEKPLRDDKGRYKGGAEGRIAELTRLRRDAERDAEYWKGLATRNGAKPGDSAAPTAKPTPDKFEDYGEYVEALTDWKAAERETKTAGERAADAEKSVDQHRAAEWSARVGAVKSNLPDFDAVMDKADTPTASHVATAIMDAERGPELLYHLASNPEIVDRLNGMSPTRAAIELGRIEATLEAPAEKPKPRETTQTKAPAPITPVQPGSTVTKDPSKMSMDEYSKWRKEQGIR